MLLNSPAASVWRLVASWTAALLLAGCAESADPNPNEDTSNEATTDEGSERPADEPGEVTLGGDHSPHATETNVMGVLCDDHAICGRGSACVVVPGQDAGEGFSRCSFVLLEDSTPCSTKADCAGDLQCLQLVAGLDAGVERICDALPMAGPGPTL